MMRRKFVLFPILLAWLMSALPSLVPHHHHQAMICTVVELCRQDGQADDPHTRHAHHEKDEAFCIAHEGYKPSETVTVDGDGLYPGPVRFQPAAATMGTPVSGRTGSRLPGTRAAGDPPPLPIPPLMAASAPHAPPVLFF